MNPEDSNNDPSKETFTDPTAPSHRLTPKKLGVFGGVGVALAGIFGAARANADHDAHRTEGPAPIEGRGPVAPASPDAAVAPAAPAEGPAVSVESAPPNMPAMHVETHATAPAVASEPAPPQTEVVTEEPHTMGGPPQAEQPHTMGGDPSTQERHGEVDHNGPGDTTSTTEPGTAERHGDVDHNGPGDDGTSTTTPGDGSGASGGETSSGA